MKHTWIMSRPKHCIVSVHLVPHTSEVHMLELVPLLEHVKEQWRRKQLDELAINMNVVPSTVWDKRFREMQ